MSIILDTALKQYVVSTNTASGVPIAKVLVIAKIALLIIYVPTVTIRTNNLYNNYGAIEIVFKRTHLKLLLNLKVRYS